MTKQEVIYKINNQQLISITSVKRRFPHLKLSNYPIEQIKAGNTDIQTYECYCDDGIVKIKGAVNPQNWHELTIGYVFAE